MRAAAKMDGWQVHTAPRASSLLHALAAGRPGTGPWLMPANACPVVPLALTAAGAEVEFIDLDPRTLGMDPALLAARLADGPTPGGVVDIRTYGSDAGADERRALVRAVAGDAVCVVDDRCAGVPATTPEELGDVTNADVVLFSTGYGKYLDRGGGGHAFVRPGVDLAPVPDPTVDFTVIERWYKRAMRDDVPLDAVPRGIRPPSPRWVPAGPGPAWRDLRAAITAGLPSITRHKAELNAIYDAHLGHLDVLAPEHQRWRYSLRVPARDGALAVISDHGGFASAHYHPASALFAAPPAPRASALHRRILNLFNDTHYSADMARRTAEAVRRHVEDHHG